MVVSNLAASKHGLSLRSTSDSLCVAGLDMLPQMRGKSPDRKFDARLICFRLARLTQISGRTPVRNDQEKQLNGYNVLADATSMVENPTEPARRQAVAATCVACG